MDRLRQVLEKIRQRLAGLSGTAKMLIATVAALAVMTLALVALYTGRSDMIELLRAGASPADQQRALNFIQSRGVAHSVGPGGAILVPAEQKPVIIGQMAQEGALPDDTSVLFNNLASKSSWTMSREQSRQQEVIALQNELSRVIGQFKGVRKAAVIIDVPQQAGLGAAVRRPTASATVFSSTGQPLDQNTVDAVAHLIAGARAGLSVDSVRVIDGTNNRQFRARSDEDAAAGAYLEHAAKVEDRTRDRLLSMLGYIRGVVVSVNARVDIRRTVSETSKVLDPGKGTVTAPTREIVSERSDSEQQGAAEPGVRSNVGLDINRASAGGSRMSDNKTETEMKTEFGRAVERVVDPRGMPTKINATINVPRSYFVALWKAEQPAQGGAAGGAAAGPADADIQPIVRREIDRIRADVQPQIDSSAEAGGTPGEVVVSMIPDAEGAIGGVQTAGAGGMLALLTGSGGGAAGGGLIKTVGLGLLALLAVGMMVMTLKKATRTEKIPTAEEMVGVPQALKSELDLVGEADEADSALAGIELSDDAMRFRKMVEQVEDLVKSKPEDAATLINRWMTEER